MCEKCTEFDFKVERYRQIAARITDTPTLDGIDGLIKEMMDVKAALHPESYRRKLVTAGIGKAAYRGGA
jgi:hypothetical protein